MFFEQSKFIHGTRGVLSQIFENVSLRKKIKDKLPKVTERMIDNRMKPFIQDQINLRIEFGMLNKKDINQSDISENIKNMLINRYLFKQIEVSHRACLNLKGKTILKKFLNIY